MSFFIPITINNRYLYNIKLADLYEVHPKSFVSNFWGALHEMGFLKD